MKAKGEENSLLNSRIWLTSTNKRDRTWYNTWEFAFKHENWIFFSHDDLLSVTKGDPFPFTTEKKWEKNIFKGVFHATLSLLSPCASQTFAAHRFSRLFLCLHPSNTDWQDSNNCRCQSVDTSVLFLPLIQFRIAGGAGAYLSNHRARGGVHPWQVPIVSGHVSKLILCLVAGC